MCIHNLIQRLQIALVLLTRVILLIVEKFTRAYFYK